MMPSIASSTREGHVLRIFSCAANPRVEVSLAMVVALKMDGL